LATAAAANMTAMEAMREMSFILVLLVVGVLYGGKAGRGYRMPEAVMLI
jgi:hypothetical protein